jgi:hypothetical protein
MSADDSDRARVSLQFKERADADGQLLKHRLSDNAGFVKYFFRALLHPLGDERHFALVEISAIPTKARS